MPRAASPVRYVSPPVEVGLGKMHHEQRHLKRCQHQQHLGDESKDIRNNPPPPLPLGFSFIYISGHKLTPDASPTQARDSELMVFTLNIN